MNNNISADVWVLVDDNFEWNKFMLHFWRPKCSSTELAVESIIALILDD